MHESCSWLGVWMGVGCPCPPVRNDIVTPRHLFFVKRLYQFKVGQPKLLETRFEIFSSPSIMTFKVLKLGCSETAQMKDLLKLRKTIMDFTGLSFVVTELSSVKTSRPVCFVLFFWGGGIVNWEGSTWFRLHPTMNSTSLTYSGGTLQYWSFGIVLIMKWSLQILNLLSIGQSMFQFILIHAHVPNRQLLSFFGQRQLKLMSFYSLL